MHQLNTFIGEKFRPNVLGGKLDKDHQSLFQLNYNDNLDDQLTLITNAICFGPKKDNVLINLEHSLKKSDHILVFYYEDIHQRWTYVTTNEESYFVYKKNALEQYRINPGYVYIRGCHIDVDDEYWQLIGNFFNFIELWKGAVLCPPKSQMANESKLFQINNSLKKSLGHFDIISIGKSYVIKGTRILKLLQEEKSYIVKSLSGIRSIVVDENDYQNWNLNNVNNLPVLFQEKILGNDLRVHVLDNKIFAKRSNFKLNIDYRYDKNFFNLSAVNDLESELINFCQHVCLEEDNILLGIDFIQTTSGYVALEANPSPGWSAYHPYNGVDDEPFLLELIRVLQSA